MAKSLTPKEREQFKDLIDEGLKNEQVIQQNKVNSLSNLAKLQTNMDLLNVELQNMVTQFDKLSQSLVKLSDKLSKPKTTEFKAPREYKE